MIKLTQVLPLMALFLATVIAGNACSAFAPSTPARSPCTTLYGSRRGKGGNLKRNLDDDSRGAPGVKSINSGRGQEITGVTIPEKGKKMLCL